MLACNACEGFVPAGVAACPNCGARKKSPLRRAVSAAAGAAVMMTLMACYGGPMTDGSCQRIPLTGNGSAEGTTHDCYEQYGSCQTGGTPRGVVAYYPSTLEVGRPGKLTISWTVIDAIVPDPGIGLYALDQSSKNQLACVSPTSGGNSITVDLQQNHGLDLVIAGAESGTYSRFRVTTSFAPSLQPK